ncbi:hypothetical protein ACIOHO_30610 [Streptomyces sp. NPDC087849]|uniref:hypothetical protein n=1 Tax=Streptomyces sp. NPDC087849 TaxID=3365808 RepID=UPI00382CE580
MGLSTGCCPDLPSGRHVIHGCVVKGAGDQDGNRDSAGTLRAVPRMVIEPVVSAVRIVEKIVPDDRLLFDSVGHTFRHTRSSDGAPWDMRLFEPASRTS